jgi:sulfoxide reductase heme-binding subunit YedZ
LHFLTYIGPDQSFDLSAMWKDIAKRPFITVGFTAFVLLIPLAVTSTTGWIRRLGGKRWQMLHRAIYVSAVLGVVHYYWLVKSDVRKPLFYGALVVILLLWRLASWISRRRSHAPVRVAAPGVSISG